MKLIFVLAFIFLNFYCNTINAQNFAVININYLIDNNNIYINKIKEIEASQDKYLNNFKNKENELNNILNEIEESKLILGENEINAKIDKYNKQLNDFTTLVEKFNFHYQNQIITMREKILSEIIVLLEEYALKNNIDLILDSSSYLIASNSIDITKNIFNELKEIKLKLEYEDFENN